MAIVNRKTLDTLYAGARGASARIFDRAAAETPLSADNYGFLLEHVAELDVDAALAALTAPLAEGVERADKPFASRLARLLETAGPSSILQVTRAAKGIAREAWLEDITLPLRGRLPEYQWYRFVDKVRGGELFDALNVGLRAPPYAAEWDPEQSFVASIEQERPEPLVVAVLDRSHDDLALAEHALANCAVADLLALHKDFPKLLPTARVLEALERRCSSKAERWEPPLPRWAAPVVVRRLAHCEDAEACALYDWLFSLPEGCHEGEAFELALARFEHAPFTPSWHVAIGRQLCTGTSWKSRGRRFIDTCIRLGRGFPPGVLRAAFEAAKGSGGSSVDDHRRSILRRIHDETAELLVDHAQRAFDAGDSERGDRFLAALLSLDPSSFIGSKLLRLRKVPGLPAEILDRIDACVAMARAGEQAPTAEGFIEAFLVLTGQLQ